MSEESNVVKITEHTYCSTDVSKSIYCFFIDDQLLYHCFDSELAQEYLKDIVRDLEEKFKKKNPNYRVFVEKINAWKYVVQRARDGIILTGKPRATHTVEIKMSQQLLKPISTR